MNRIKMEFEDGVRPNNICFICLQQVTTLNKEFLNSINFLLNYLDFKSEIKSVVCQKCAEHCIQFAKLSKILEKVSLEMDYLLGLIQSAISKSNQNLKPAAIHVVSIRESVLKKCKEEMLFPKPQIILRKLDISNIKTRSQSLIDSSDDSPNWDDYSTSDQSRDNQTPATSPLEQMENNFDTRNFENSRLNTKTTKTKPKCPTCFKPFVSKSQLQLHINAVHLRLKPFKCDMCDKSFANIYKLKTHKTTPHKLKPRQILDIADSKPFPCKKCEKIFDSLKPLKMHMRNVHPEKQFQCSVCNRVFKNRFRLETHFSAIHQKQRHPCQAPSCNKSYSAEWTLVTHYRKDHPDFVFEQKQDYFSDKFKVIDSNGVSAIECMLCGGQFKHSKSVKEHLRIYHGLVGFECQHCDYATPCQTRLNNHIKQDHEGVDESKTIIKIETDTNCADTTEADIPANNETESIDPAHPLKCPTCLKNFSSDTSLRRHINTVHLRLKPYKCDVCGKSYRDKSDLRSHAARPHKQTEVNSNSKLSSCEICGKTFNTSASLKMHFALHEKQRYQCQVPSCNKSYTQPAALFNHCKLDHPEQIIPHIPSTPEH